VKPRSGQFSNVEFGCENTKALQKEIPALKHCAQQLNKFCKEYYSAMRKSLGFVK